MRRRSFVLLTTAALTGLGFTAGYNWWATRRLLIRLNLISPPANLLRNSDFSIRTNPNVPDYWGTTSPASLPEWAEAAAFRIEGVGPLKGVSVLHLRNPRREHSMSFMSHGAFVPQNGSYTFSVYLRSDFENAPAVMTVGWSEPEPIEVGTSWQRYSMTHAAEAEAAHGRAIPVKITLSGEGSLWIAAPQLEKGGKATEFSPALMDDHPPLFAESSASDFEEILDQPIRTLADIRVPAVAKTSSGASSIGTQTGSSVSPAKRTIRAIAVSEPEDWCLDDIAGHGFNAVSIFVPTAEKSPGEMARVKSRFDAAASRNLSVIPFLDNAKNISFDQVRDRVTATIRSLREHPAIVSWMILDEPSRWWSGAGREERHVAELYNAAKHSDPQRPIFVNDNTWKAGIGGYGSLGATDIGCNDVYPIGQYANAVQLVAERCAVIGRDCIAAGKAAAFWLQLYGYDDAVREPTPAEQRAMTYAAYLSGMRVLLYWLYKPMSTALWESMAELGAEIDRLDESASQRNASCTRLGRIGRRTHYAFWESGEASYLVVCNTGVERATAQFVLSKLASRRFAKRRAWYGRADSGSGDELILSLDGYQREVVELS